MTESVINMPFLSLYSVQYVGCTKPIKVVWSTGSIFPPQPRSPQQMAGGHGQQNSNFSPKQRDEFFLGGYVSLWLPSLKIGK